jgi:hypothetical protein
LLKKLTNVGEELNESEAKAFKDNININEQGLFDYNGKFKKKFFLCFFLILLFS